MSETNADHVVQGHTPPHEYADTSGVAVRLPLSALLSQVLVAFTIEFDNEFEHQMPHRTTSYGSTSASPHAPWLVSLVMWSNAMQFVSEEGITLAELFRLARTETNIDGLRRWGYITIQPDTKNSRSKRPRSDAVIRPTHAGRQVQAIWQPLFATIEERWQKRFGRQEIDQLREALWAVVRQLEWELPDCLPILEYGLSTIDRRKEQFLSTPVTQRAGNASELPLSALLSKVLLASAIEFERESDVSLAVAANVVRILNEQGLPVRDLPRYSGISREAINMALTFLQKKNLIIVEPEPGGSRFKIARLTVRGQEVQANSQQLLSSIEARWMSRFGKDVVCNLRQALERLVNEPGRASLFKGMEPYPDGWRASLPRPETLPYYPVVLHRGGFPDGS